jgi:hypothetical protein
MKRKIYLFLWTLKKKRRKNIERDRANTKQARHRSSLFNDPLFEIYIYPSEGPEIHVTENI